MVHYQITFQIPALGQMDGVLGQHSLCKTVMAMEFQTQYAAILMVNLAYYRAVKDASSHGPQEIV